MANRERPIRIEIPEEHNLSQNEIDALAFAFLTRLVDVLAPDDLEASPIESINTTKLAVEIDVIGRPQTVTVKKPVRVASKKSKK